MTSLERSAISKLLESLSAPSVVGTVYDGRKMTTITPHQEVSRLLKSPDYRAGWENCRKHTHEVLEFIMAAERAELVKYTGRRR